MEKREDLEAWADALLDQHRTVPNSSAARSAQTGALSDDSFSVRLMTALNDGRPPDAEMLERMRRIQPVHNAVSKGYALSAILGVIVLTAFLSTALRAFA